MLFGRTKELEFLTDRLGRDRRVVVGEAGIGKVAHGHSNAEIGRRLGLSRATVAEHVSSAATKLGARSRAQAAALAAQA